MADAGFFRGTSSDQDGRFSDKEKKLLKVMRFEGLLETKINMRKVNLDVIKPWITVRINEILENEDDVLIEYIINQLEAKDLNPKIMQINITGFLNARHARQFMGELWALLNEAQEAEDGVPPSLVEKKMVEMKKEGELNGTSKPAIKTLAQNDWAHRYQNLSLGRFSGTTKEKEVRDDRIVPRSLKSPERRIGSAKTGSARKKFDDRRGDRDRDREKGDRGDRDRERGERSERSDRERDRREKQTDKEREVESKRREEERLKRRAAEKERDRKRDEERDKRRHERRRRSRTRSRSPPRRRFTEDSGDRKKKRKESSDSESEIESKKEKKKEKRRDISSEDEKKEKDRKEKKKHKKEKKKKERKRSPSPSSDSDSD